MIRRSPSGVRGGLFVLACAAAIAAAAGGCNRRSPAASSAPANHTPVVADDGWPVSTAEAQGLSAARLDDVYRAAGQLGNLYSLVVVKNGFLVGEQYFNGSDRTQASHTASVTKSLTSALVGLLFRDRILTSLDQKMAPFFPEIDWQQIDPRKREITIGQLLQMRSGYPWEERSGDLAAVAFAANKIPLIEQIPLAADPGTDFNYSNLGAHLLGIVVSRASGQSLASLAQTSIFDALGGRIAGWPTDALGYNTGYGDVQLTARDMAKFGLLYLNGGQYAGRQILPSAWIAASLQPASLNVYGRPMLDDVRELDYGFMWWSGDAGPHGVDFAWGHGGQLIVLVSDLRMVVVAKARPQPGFDNASWQQESAVMNLVFHFVASL